MSNSISGNAGVAGAAIALTGAATASTTSAADGTYSFPGLLAGAYVVTPTLAGVTFTPTHLNETIVATDITTANFVAQATVFAPSPIVTDNFTRADHPNLGAAWTITTDTNAPIAIASNLAVPGLIDGAGPDYLGSEIYTKEQFADNQEASVTINAWGANSEIDLSVRNDITDSTGYSAGLSALGAGNLTLDGTAAQIGVAATVVPVQGDVLSIQAVGTLITVFYNGVPVISGTDTGTASGSPSIYIQSTASQTDTSLSSFSAGSEVFVISGSCGAAGAGATVNLSGAATASTTAAAVTGDYSFTNLPAGTYQVTPGLTGSMFSPSQQIVVITTADVTGINFTLFTPAASGAGSGRIASPGASFATRIESPNTEIMGINLRTRILE